jgi:MSHA biogenesis protein MshM
MYLQHFHLKEFPFGITPDTSFFFSSEASQQALNTLLVATRAGEGFIKITGEVGTGKTLLCRQLLQSLGSDFQTAYIPNPSLTPLGLLQELAEELNADTSGLAEASEAQYQHLLLKALRERLLQLAAENRPVLVCLDEVQAMPIETLEALRLLTNLETQKRKLVQVVIFGQPELDAKLDHPSIRQLKQRITFDYHLGPLTGPELARYLDHRMAVAGYDGAQLFSAPAVWILRWRTRGFPRLVNIVANKALMGSYGRGKKTVGLREMKEAIDDTAPLRLPLLRMAMAGGLIVALGLVILRLARTV